MNRQLTAIVERDGDGYVAFRPEVDVASQGNTVAEASTPVYEASPPKGASRMFYAKAQPCLYYWHIPPKFC